MNREDSDDELGLEDHPWQWIYSTDSDHVPQSVTVDEPLRPSPGKAESRSRRGRQTPLHDGHAGKRRIVGARMGTFECMIGESVLLKAEGTNEAWVGLICEFQEEEEDRDGKAANFMWFSTEKEIRNKQKKRSDALQVRWGCGSALISASLRSTRTKSLCRTSSTSPRHGI